MTSILLPMVIMDFKDLITLTMSLMGKRIYRRISSRPFP